MKALVLILLMLSSPAIAQTASCTGQCAAFARVTRFSAETRHLNTRINIPREIAEIKNAAISASASSALQKASIEALSKFSLFEGARPYQDRAVEAIALIVENARSETVENFAIIKLKLNAVEFLGENEIAIRTITRIAATSIGEVRQNAVEALEWVIRTTDHRENRTEASKGLQSLTPEANVQREAVRAESGSNRRAL